MVYAELQNTDDMFKHHLQNQNYLTIILKPVLTSSHKIMTAQRYAIEILGALKFKAYSIAENPSYNCSAIVHYWIGLTRALLIVKS